MAKVKSRRTKLYDGNWHPDHNFSTSSEKKLILISYVQIQPPGSECQALFLTSSLNLETTTTGTRSAPVFTWSCPSRARASSCSISPTWLVALATSARSRSRSASSCSMCCCFSFSASWRAVVPEILRAYREEVSVNCKGKSEKSRTMMMMLR